MNSQALIAVFDSGLGGLTVVKSLLSLMPGSHILYLGDTARLPYGSKSPETIKKYLFQNINYLKKYHAKAIVVACNSASSVLDPQVFIDQPVIGMIEAGVQSALRLTKNNKVGVIGTRATISSGCYINALKKADPRIEVFQQSCPLFVPLVEEGWVDDPLTNLVAYRYLAGLLQTGIDTLILGCTHYPLLEASIVKVCGPHIAIANPATFIYNQLEPILKLAPEVTPLLNKSRVDILCTDMANHFKDLARSILGSHVDIEFTAVDL